MASGRDGRNRWTPVSFAAFGECYSVGTQTKSLECNSD
jgi:hypothetical protein